MTPEVKKRIDQIRQGIVPEGYKKTESGIIPNEWRVEQVSKCIEEYKFFSNDISHIPVYSSSRKGLVPQSDYYNQREAVETNLGYKVVPQGYVTYRHMSDDDVFHFNINKTGENVLVSSEYPVFTSSDNCDLSFLISVLNNTARFRYFCKMQKLGGTRTRLYLDNLKRYALALPPFDEQKKIAEILATQDKAIELQARKIEELKRFKKGCLEKMFPRKGQKVPEKRFPGFTDDWEQRKLGELGSLKNGMNFSKEAMGIGFPFVNLQNIFGNNVIDVTNLGKAMASDSQLKDYNLLNGDVLFVRSSVKLEGVGEAALVPQNLENTTYSGFIIRFRDEYGLHTLIAHLDIREEVNWDWFILLVAKTGMRFSEALAITPSDFDFARQTLSISKTWDYKGNGGFLPTKNNSSVRKIQIDWQIVVKFSELTKNLPEDKPIFVGETKIYNSTVNDVLTRHCKACGISEISIHGLRHTHASLLLFAGVSIASVARRLGHASMTTTQKTYLHIIQELENKDVDLVMRTLSGL